MIKVYMSKAFNKCEIGKNTYLVEDEAEVRDSMPFFSECDTLLSYLQRRRSGGRDVVFVIQFSNL